MSGRSATKREVLTGIGAFALGAGALDAARSTENDHFCDDEGRRVVHPPAVIDEPGEYALHEDYEGPAAARDGLVDDVCIWIRVDDVELYGNGHTLTGEENGYGVFVGDRAGDGVIEGVIVRDFEVTNWNRGLAVGTASGESGGDTVVESVTANENEDRGITIWGANTSEYRDITASNNGGSGIHIWEANEMILDDVTVEENGGHGLHFHDVAVGSQFSNIDIIGNDGDGINSGIDVANTYTDLTIAKNDGAGIDTADGGPDKITDSVIRENGGPGVTKQHSFMEFDNTTILRNDGWQLNASSGEDDTTATNLGIGQAATVQMDSVPARLDAVNRDDHPELPDGERSVSDGLHVEVVEDRYTPEDWFVETTLEYDADEAELWYHDGNKWTPLGVFGASGLVNFDITEDGVYLPVRSGETDEGDGDDDDEPDEDNGGDDDENGEESDDSEDESDDGGEEDETADDEDDESEEDDDDEDDESEEDDDDEDDESEEDDDDEDDDDEDDDDDEEDDDDEDDDDDEEDDDDEDDESEEDDQNKEEESEEGDETQDDVIAVADQTDEQALGMGIVSAVTAMGGAAYLFARRVRDGNPER